MKDDVSACEMIENLPYALDDGIGARARIGLVVLSSDYTIEHEFRRMVDLDGVDFYHARIHCASNITPQTLSAMGPLISDTVNLILPGSHLDVVGFGCTSASMVLGPDYVANRVRAVRPDAKVTNPITAAMAAFDAFGARRIAVLTPYRRDVNEVVRDYIEEQGYSVPVFGSFNQEDDGVVARIDAASVREAVRRVTAGRSVDAVFVSCTSVRLAEAVAGIEEELGLPVTSSNHAMAWHCLRLAGVTEPRAGHGRLFML